MRYMHVPLAVDAGGLKLSKSSDAPRLAAAAPATQLLAALEFLGQEPPDWLEGTTVAEVLEWASAGWRPQRFAGVASKTAPMPG
jgi:glutamyl-Q tRNA(Asp) synthetase